MQVTLWLEKLYLTEQATAQRLKTDAKSSAIKSGRQDGAAQDIWEKRQLKVMRKLRDQLRKEL